MSSHILILYTYLGLVFIFSFLKVFNIPFSPGFLKFHNNMLWCGYWAWGGFRQGDPWFQFWEFYFCIISLNIASFVFYPFFFSLLGTPAIWILTILDGSCNFLLFPIFSLFILLLYFLTVNLMFKISCYLKLFFFGLLIFIFKRSVWFDLPLFLFTFWFWLWVCSIF